jgi:O-antigen ligase
MWAVIPFSLEIDLPGGLSTDLPAEPLMWMSCLLLIGYLYLYNRDLDFSFILHPVFVILVLHFSWIILTSITSNDPLISVKYTLAKSWYLVCFVFIPLILFRDVLDFRQWGLFVLIPLIGTIVIILYRHSQYGFSFETINNAVIPIYRNHVDYACSLGVALPFVWLFRKWFTGISGKLLFILSIVLILAGIYFSYTRAAWLCVPVAIIIYFMIRFRLMRFVIPIALAVMILIVGWLSYENAYLEYAPDYEKAISHKKFDALVSATYKMEDISTVERFYRWVAGFYMVQENPVLGFGPATFYSFYHNYVDRHFTTYVSDNPEKSGMHNYYLMVAVEQGLTGLAIFLMLVVFVLVYGEKLFHQIPAGPKKQILTAALVSFGCNLFVLTLNDMVETDKLGSYFFFSIAIVILYGMEMKRTTKQSR